MKNNKTIRSLEQLNRREMTRFAEFVHSPYFNKHQDVKNLVDYLSQIYPDFSEKKVHRTVLFDHLYPALPHNQQQLAIIFTYTHRLLEQFLIQEQAVKENFFDNKALYYKALRERHLFFLLKNNWEENVGKVNYIPGNYPDKNIPSDRQEESFEKQFQLAAELDALSMELGAHDQDFLIRKQYWLDAFYLSEKFKDACELLQRSVLSKKKFEENDFLKMAQEALGAAAEKFEQVDLVLVFSKLYHLLKDSDPARYKAVLTYISERQERLSHATLQIIYNYLQNFCIQQINAGHQQFLRELFELYKFQLGQDLLIVDGILPEWHFKNIVTTGLRLDENHWVRNFLDHYSQRLRPEVAENAYSYNLAAYFYHLKNYHEVLRLLLHVEYTDVRYNLDAKSLLLRTYYDLEEGEPLHFLTEAFKQYLKRNKSLSEFQKKGYFNLLKYTSKAFRLKTNRDYMPPAKWKADIQKLRQDLANAETVFNQSWLKGKIEDLADY